jgi:hypothetical protein
MAAAVAEIKELIAIPHFKIYANNISIYENLLVYMTTSNDIIIHDNIKNKTSTICWHNAPLFIENKERDIGIICITKNHLMIGHEFRLYIIPINVGLNGDIEFSTSKVFVDILPNFELIESIQSIQSIQSFHDHDNVKISTYLGNESYTYNITNRTFRNRNDQDTQSTQLLLLNSTEDIVYKDLTHKAATHLFTINIKANLTAYVDESSSTVLYTVLFNHYLKLDADVIEWCSEKVPFVSPQEFIIDLKITDTIIIVMTYKNIYYRVVHDAVEWCLFTVIGNGEVAQPPRFKMINYENPQEPEDFDDEIPVIWSQLIVATNNDVIYAVSIDGYVFKLCPSDDDAYILSKGMIGIMKFRNIIDNYIFGENYKIELIKEGLEENHDTFEEH